MTLPGDIGRAAANNAIKEGKALGAGINTARELGNLPGNVAVGAHQRQRLFELWLRPVHSVQFAIGRALHLEEFSTKLGLVRHHRINEPLRAFENQPERFIL